MRRPPHWLPRAVRRSAGLPVSLEPIEPRLLLSAAFDTVQLTTLRNDANFAGIDGSGVGIAVLDSGVFSTHPDLRNNFVGWYDAVRRTESSTPFDPDGHGTHVSGTAASTNPQIGVATRARLVGVRALPADDEPFPNFDPVEEALRWVRDNAARFNIRVVNMSLGTRQNFNSVPSNADGEAAIIRELEARGITVVSASGNSYADFASPGAAAPAIFSSLSVASTWEDDGAGDDFPILAGGGGPFAAFEREGRRDRFAASSQRSTLPNQVAAPGQTIFSTWNGVNGRLYNTIFGTSMASPLVAGMVALMQDAAQTYGNRYLTVQEVVSIVRATGDTIIDSNVTTNGRIRIQTREQFDLPETGLSFKRVNVYNAVREVRRLLTGGTGPGTVAGDSNNTRSTAVQLGAVNGSRELEFTGFLGNDGQVSNGAQDVDLFRIVVQSRGTVRVSLGPTSGGQSFDSYLRLFSSTGVELFANNDASGQTQYSVINTSILEPGTYFIGVSANANTTYNTETGAPGGTGNSTGDYLLDIALDNPDPNGVITGAVPFSSLPITFNGFIGADLGINVGSQDVDFFQVIAPDSGVLTVDISSGSFGDEGVDSVIRVFDESFNQIAFDDDRTPGNRDPLVRVNLTRGQIVYVAVADFENRNFDPRDPYTRDNSGPGGLYDIALSFDNRDSDGTVFTARTLAPGSSIAGEVGRDGAGLLVGSDGSKDVDFFEVTTSAAGVLELRLTSPDASLQGILGLWVYDETVDDVVKVAESADVNAGLVFRVAGGQTFYVSVTGLGNQDFKWFAAASGSGGDVGGYTLAANVRGNAFARARSNDSVNNATPTTVAFGDEIKADIGTDGEFLVGEADIDVYRFTPTRSQTVLIRANTKIEFAADTVLRVFDAAGNEIAFNDDINASTTGSLVRLNVIAGVTYYIGVNGFSAGARGYNVVTGAGAADGDTGVYVLQITGPIAPDIEVSGGAQNLVIDSGDTTPRNADFTNFQPAFVDNQTRVRLFTITNRGQQPLRLLGAGGQFVTLSGPAAGEFVVVEQPTSPVAPGASVTFTVRFDPASLGRRDAIVTVRSNDRDEGAYTFAVAGTGLATPNLQVFGGRLQTIGIGSGDSTPRPADFTSFGTVGTGQTRTRTFTIRNTGSGVLRLTPPRLSIGGADASSFSLVSALPASLAGGASVQIQVRFTPGSAGVRDALLQLTSNDPDTPLYTFAIRGTGA